MKRREWIERIRAVERESEVVAIALDLLQERLRQEPSFLRAAGYKTNDANRVETRREPTYLLRLFAVFENALRDAWANAERQRTQPPSRDLIDAFAARATVPDGLRTDAHVVRAYRNAIAHDESEPIQPVDLPEARRRLCRFLSYLPENW